MRRTLQAVPGVRKVRVSYDKNLVEVWSDPGKTPRATLIKALTGLGYKAWDTASEKPNRG